MNPTVMFVRLSENCNAGCFMCYFAHQHGLYNITDEQCHAIYEDLAKYTNAYKLSINFGIAAIEDIPVQIFYAKQGENNFTEENSIKATLYTGERVLSPELPKGTYDKIRIDIGISIREIKITIDELSLDYNVSYTFTDKLRFKTYNDETKDKDQELINMCNEILVKGYITLLYRSFFDENIKTEIHSNIKEYCEDSLEDTLGKIDDTKKLNELLLQINK